MRNNAGRWARAPTEPMPPKPTGAAVAFVGSALGLYRRRLSRALLDCEVRTFFGGGGSPLCSRTFGTSAAMPIDGGACILRSIFSGVGGRTYSSRSTTGRTNFLGGTGLGIFLGTCFFFGTCTTGGIAD